MNADLTKNKLQVHYRVLQPGETETVWVAGTSAGDTVPERWPAWQMALTLPVVPCRPRG